MDPNNPNNPRKFDFNNYPSLTAKSSSESLSSQNSFVQKPYTDKVKVLSSDTSEFVMTTEDFPALPSARSSSSTYLSSGQTSKVGSSHHFGPRPSGVLKDQYGMKGLAAILKSKQENPNAPSNVLDTDLTTLGVDINNPSYIYPSFGGALAEQKCRPQDIDCYPIPEYRLNAEIKKKLAPVKLDQYKDSHIFYLFYNNVNDVMQAAAASELYKREWRYHKKEKMWLTQVPRAILTEQTPTYECSTYYFFDPFSWQKIEKEFRLEYSQLEGRPVVIPTHYTQ